MVNLLLNILIIILCIFSYYLFIMNNELNGNYNKVAIGFVSIIAITLCMYFPFHDYNGHYFDLRFVAFIIGALYGGKLVGFVLFISLITVRTMIGIDEGLFVTVALTLISYIYTIIYTNKFQSYSSNKKIIHVMTILFIIWTINPYNIRIFYQEFDFQAFLLLIEFHIINLFASFFAVYLIENIHENLKMKDELIEAEKLRVVSELAASVSHEVRNPLAVTRGFLQLLKDENLSTEKRNLYLDLSLEELDRAQNIITDYLTYARPQNTKNNELLYIKTELQYLVQVMRPFALMQGVSILEKQVDEDCYIKGDKHKFRQCLVNFVKNGIESMTNGGFIELSARCSGINVTISIGDCGNGMTKEEIEQLGFPFRTTKEKGTGLGTSVSYKIVNQMEGSIKVESEVGVGTTFHLIFPRVVVK